MALEEYLKDLSLDEDISEPIGAYKEEYWESCKPENRIRIRTGYRNLDMALNGGLGSEFYVIGGETGIGKSAFLMSVAQNIAGNGVDVLYFSLEMGKSEFVSRGESMLSFISNEKNHGHAYSAGELLSSDYDPVTGMIDCVPREEFEEYMEEYFHRYGKHLGIIDANGFTIRKILRICAAHKKKIHPRKMVVFIDYFQIIRSEQNDYSQADRKTKNDIVASALKGLSSELGIPVIAVSSVSRTKYGSRVDTSSFKESGDIEYTGGVLLGWNQLEDNADDEGYRIMSLDILKARNARKNMSVRFKYFPKYNYFEEMSLERIDGTANSGEYVNGGSNSARNVKKIK